MHGWKSCREKTTELLDKVSNISVEHRTCLTNVVLSRASSLSVDPLSSLQADTGVAVPGAIEATQETLTGNNAQPQTNEESTETCTLNAKSKVIALMVGSEPLCEAMWSNGRPLQRKQKANTRRSVGLIVL